MRIVSVLAVGLLIGALAACGDSAGSETKATVISTNAADDSIALDSQTVGTGAIAFDITNDGTVVHEIEVFAGSQTDLPVDLGVADTAGLTLVDEVEDIIPGGNVTLNLDLEPGDYVIICNLPGHYELGMVNSLTVTG